MGVLPGEESSYREILPLCMYWRYCKEFWNVSFSGTVCMLRAHVLFIKVATYHGRYSMSLVSYDRQCTPYWSTMRGFAVFREFHAKTLHHVGNVTLEWQHGWEWIA
jgi:hypothetical protein